MAKTKKKYYKVVKSFTYKGKFHKEGSKVYLSDEHKKVLIELNLIK